MSLSFLPTLKNKILFSVVFLLIIMSNLCLADTVDTQLSSDHITLSDTVFVTYVVSGSNTKRSPDFSALENDFRILNTNYGNEINMVNGITSMQTFWRLQLAPKRTGELMLPEINFGSHQSTTRKLIVTSAVLARTMENNSNNAVSAKQSAPVFVRGEISSTAPYVEGLLQYTFKLYFRTQLRNPRVDMPQIKDVVLMQLEDGPLYQTTINGEVYNVVEKTFAIFPKKPGTITISPIRLQALIIDDNANTYDDFFNFGAGLKPISVATKSFKLNVRDVPTTYHGTIWLPAQNISLTEEWSTQNIDQWETGTPVTRTLKIEAIGLRADQLPDFSIDKINDVNIYVDRPKRTNTIKNNMIVGTLKQNITYIPNNTQSFILPPLKINWWNTKTNLNEVSGLNGVTVQVKPAKNVANFSHNNNRLNAISEIRERERSLTSNHARVDIFSVFYSSIWPILASMFFIAWIITLLMLCKKFNTKDKTTMATEIETQVTDEINGINEKCFEEACRTGKAHLAQQYLLKWAKTKWQEKASDLTSLRDLISDVPFGLLLLELERALYAKGERSWRGETLYASFQRIKKIYKHFSVRNIDKKENPRPMAGPLPPLYP
jgi:hypothetical protein